MGDAGWRYIEPYAQWYMLITNLCFYFFQKIKDSGSYSYSEARVCRDNTVITSRGPGSCFEFALAIVEALCGEKTAKEIAEPMFVKI